MPHPPTTELTGTRKLLPGQARVLDAGFLESGQSWLLEMPTGSGKTWLSEQAIEHALQQGRKAVYVAPIKALTQSQYTDWCYRFGADNVAISDSDHALNAEAIADVRLLVTTPESLEACLRQPRAYLPWIKQLSLVVIDEIDLIHDGWRGARLEGAILQLQLLNPLLRVIGITATLGDEADLRSWLGAAFMRTTHRAVPLHWQQIRFWTAAEKQNRAVNYLSNAIAKGHPCLVFCQSRQRTEQLGQRLQARGIAALWHHAGLEPHARATAEDAFQCGKVQVLVATATLAMGVNLPAREVLIYDTHRPGGNGEFEPMPKRELIQMAGRAGRPGFDEQGTVTLLVHEKEVSHWRDTHQQVLQPIRSALADPALLTERILTAINGHYARTSVQLQRFLDRTLAAQQGLLPNVLQLLTDMQRSGMVTVGIDGKFATTSLSELAVRHYLQPATALHFQQSLQIEPLYLFDLLLVVCSCPDFAPLLSVKQEQVTQSERCLATVATALMQSPETLEIRLHSPQAVLVKVVYTACVLQTWTVCGDVTDTAESMDCAYPQDVEKAIASAQRLLEALLELCTISALPTADSDARHAQTAVQLAALIDMVTHGFSPDETTLLSVPGVTAAKAKQLIRHRIHSAKQLGQTRPKVLAAVPGFNEKLCTKTVQYARAVAPQLPTLSEPHNAEHCQQSVRTLRRLWITTQTNWRR